MATIGFQAEQGGLHLVEVQALGDSTYQLLLAGDVALQDAASSNAATVIPEHPLTVSDPLSAGGVVTPVPPGFLKPYFPVLMWPVS